MDPRKYSTRDFVIATLLLPVTVPVGIVYLVWSRASGQN